MLITPIFRSYTSEKESAKKKKEQGRLDHNQENGVINCTPREELHTHTHRIFIGKRSLKKSYFQWNSNSKAPTEMDSKNKRWVELKS